MKHLIFFIGLLTFIRPGYMWATPSSGVAIVAQEINGQSAFATDVDGDGKFDFYEVPFKNGYFVEWMEDNQRYRHYLQKIDELKFKKVFVKLEEKKWIILEEVHLENIGNYAKVEKHTRIAPGQYTIQEFFEPTQQMQSSTDRIYNDLVEYTTGSPSQGRQLAQDRRSYNHFYNLQIRGEGLACRRDLLGADIEALNTQIDEIIQTTQTDPAQYFDVQGCGEDFSSHTIPEALGQGLRCLNEMGGAARGHAANLVAVILNSSTLSTRRGKFRVDCSRPQSLIGSNDQVAAHGAASATCDRSWPEVQLFPGAEGRQPGASAQIRRERQKATLFHEMFHNIGYYHTGGEPDLTYMCTFACFQGTAFTSSNVSSATVSRARADARHVCRGDRRSVNAQYISTMNDVIRISEGSPSVAIQSAYFSPWSSSNFTQTNSNIRPADFTGTLLIYYMTHTPMADQDNVNYRFARHALVRTGILVADDLTHLRYIAQEIQGATPPLSDSSRNIKNETATRIQNIYNTLAQKVATSSGDTRTIANDALKTVENLWLGYCRQNITQITDVSHCPSRRGQRTISGQRLELLQTP